MPTDAETFWRAGHAATSYGEPWTMTERYVYPPVLAQVTGLLSWAAFIVPWMLAIFARLWGATAG